MPFQHPQIDEWRENFKGVRFVHEPSNILVTGAVDDIWQNEDGELIVVDYKATSKSEEVNLDAEWQITSGPDPGTRLVAEASLLEPIEQPTQATALRNQLRQKASRRARIALSEQVAQHAAKKSAHRPLP